MISDSDLADICLALYAYPDSPKVSWDYYQDWEKDDGIRFAMKQIDGHLVVCYEGTTSIRDAVRDLCAIDNPFTHSQLGPISFGMWDGMPEAFQILRGIIAKTPLPIILCGHSLGAAHATLILSLLVVNGLAANTRRVCFGEPRAATAKLRNIIAHVPTVVYHNHLDLISDLPITIPGVAEYTDSFPRTELHVTPHGKALLWGPFAPHHMQLYREGVK